jgi:uncharacterized protein YegP (UPF0339 family)
MAGMFEVFVDSNALFRFRLKAADGTVMAVSEAFADKPAVAAGIAAMRECAGTGLVTDLSRIAAQPVAAPAPAAAPAAAAGAVQPACEEPRMALNRLRAFAPARVPRRHVSLPKWTGAA